MKEEWDRKQQEDRWSWRISKNQNKKEANKKKKREGGIVKICNKNERKGKTRDETILVGKPETKYNSTRCEIRTNNKKRLNIQELT